MTNYIVLLATIIFSVLANILMKKGSFALGGVPLSVQGILDIISLMFRNLYVMGGLALYGTAFFLWVWLLSKMQLNVLYPISLSAQLVLLTLASWLLFKESLSAVQVGGILAIVLGIMLLARPQ